MLLLASAYGTICATDPTIPETRVSDMDYLDIIGSNVISVVAADLEVMRMKVAFDDPGGHARSIAVPKISNQVLENSDSDDQLPAAARPKHVAIRCNDQNLQKFCGSPPINARCTEGCHAARACHVIVDSPHMLCESDCTCITGDPASIPIVNEFADLE